MIISKRIAKIAIFFNLCALAVLTGCMERPTATRGAWGPNYANHLYFYNAGSPYYEFTNYYLLAKPVEIDGKKWTTTEHYFQAQKYPNTPWLQNKIQAAGTPREAFNIGRDSQYSQYKDKNWDTNKYQIMKKAVRAKFTQDEALKRLLINTGDKILVEDAGVKDADWGAGANYNGGNNLGKALMAIRDELTQKAAPQWTKDQQTIINYLKVLQQSAQGKPSEQSVTMLVNWLVRQHGAQKSTWERVKAQMEPMQMKPDLQQDLVNDIIHFVDIELNK